MAKIWFARSGTQLDESDLKGEKEISWCQNNLGPLTFFSPLGRMPKLPDEESPVSPDRRNYKFVIIQGERNMVSSNLVSIFHPLRRRRSGRSYKNRSMDPREDTKIGLDSMPALLNEKYPGGVVLGTGMERGGRTENPVSPPFSMRPEMLSLRCTYLSKSGFDLTDGERNAHFIIRNIGGETIKCDRWIETFLRYYKVSLGELENKLQKLRIPLGLFDVVRWAYCEKFVVAVSKFRTHFSKVFT